MLCLFHVFSRWNSKEAIKGISSNIVSPVLSGDVFLYFVPSSSFQKVDHMIQLLWKPYWSVPYGSCTWKKQEWQKTLSCRILNYFSTSTRSTKLLGLWSQNYYKFFPSSESKTIILKNEIIIWGSITMYQTCHLKSLMEGLKS